MTAANLNAVRMQCSRQDNKNKELKDPKILPPMKVPPDAKGD